MIANRKHFDDFKDSNGKLDWDAYKKYEVSIGSRCNKCGAYILFEKGFPDHCNQCKKLDNPGEVNFGNAVRCPSCTKSFDPYDYELYDILEDGEHTIICPDCDYEFEISTHVTFEFDSPALLGEHNEESNSNSEE